MSYPGQPVGGYQQQNPEYSPQQQAGYGQSTYPPVQAQVTTVPVQPPLFRFDGGAGTFLGTLLLGIPVTVVTFGICYPWAVVMIYRWRAKHTFLNGYRLVFTGTAWGLFGRWLLWWFLCLITFGIYSFWVYPAMTKWLVDHQAFATA